MACAINDATVWLFLWDTNKLRLTYCFVFDTQDMHVFSFSWLHQGLLTNFGFPNEEQVMGSPTATAT